MNEILGINSIQKTIYFASRRVSDNFQTRLIPEAIITDYKTGVAAEQFFLISEHWECFSQCFFEKYKELVCFDNVKKLNLSKTNARMLFALVFLPEQEIKEAFTKYEQEQHLHLKPYPHLGRISDCHFFWIFRSLSYDNVEGLR